MKSYPSDLTDGQWQFIKNILGDERKRQHSLRQIWNAILYLVKTGCQWRMLPKCFPHWAAVYYYFKKWKRDGAFEEILDKLNAVHRQSVGKNVNPSLGIIDSQSVKVSHLCSEQSGYDAGKRVKGRKRHIITDTLGCLHVVVVHAANLQDRNGIKKVLPVLKDKWLSGIKKIVADGGYSGKPIWDWVKASFNWQLEIVSRDKTDKFKVLPKRWIVERTFAWISFSRRNSKDYERLTESSETFTQLALVRIFLNKLEK